MSLHRDDVTPLPKPARRDPASKRRLPVLGPKGKRNRQEIADSKVVLIQRSKGRCEVHLSPRCKVYGSHAHHLRRRSQGGSNAPENLVWVCEPCHSMLHANPALAVKLDLLRPSWTPDDAA